MTSSIKTLVHVITSVERRRRWSAYDKKAIILDLFSRKVVGMALSDHMRSSLILAALNQALLLRKPRQGIIHHSDLEAQYTSNDFHEVIKAHGIRLNHGNKGSAYDNAAMESFFHTLKTEHVYLKTTRLWMKQK